MTNDAKLGMLAGVAGVVVAAALGTNPSPPEPPSAVDSATVAPGVTPQAGTAGAGANGGRPVASTPAPGRGSEPPLPHSPVVRTRPEVPAWPASRPTPSLAEEP